MVHDTAARPHRTRRVVVAGSLLTSGTLLGAGGALVATRALRDAPAGPTGPVPTAAVPDRASAAAGTVPQGFAPPGPEPASSAPVSSAPPVEIDIPDIGVRSGLVGLRLSNDGTLQVPTDYASAGWYSAGSAPGDAGAPAVIAGHVDSTNGPAVFYRLQNLAPGRQMLLRRADGTTARFVVDKLADYSKTGFPADEVYAPTRRPEIRLITCTGRFDSSTRHYLNNLVVFAHQDPVGAAP